MILYEGPSRLTGDPIVAIVTGHGFGRRSKNKKVGKDASHIWILRSDLGPRAAVIAGADEAICGDCGWRDNGCYVLIDQAPRAVYDCYAAGGYEYLNTGDLAAVFADLFVRFGAYGDCAALPLRLIERIARACDGWTAFTHQWRRFPALRRLCMASVDSLDEARDARARGWRYFMTHDGGNGAHDLYRHVEQQFLPHSFGCPASEEQGYRTDCYHCRACDGTHMDAKPATAASVNIVLHGPAKPRKQLVQLSLEN